MTSNAVGSTSPGKALRRVISQMTILEGVRATATSDKIIHVHFDVFYEEKIVFDYFVKVECLTDSRWRVFSHSLPHYLPMEATLGTPPPADPVEIVQRTHRFLESLAARQEQAEVVKAKYAEILKITNSATYDFVRLSFKRETKADLLRGVWFDLKYTLLDKFPSIVNITLPARTRKNITSENNTMLQSMVNRFKSSSIVGVIDAVVED